MRRRAWTTPTPIVVAIMVVEAVVEMILVAAWIAVVGSVVARATSIIVLAIIAVATMVAVVGAIAYVRTVVAIVGAIAYIGSVTVVVSHIGTVIPIPAVCGCLALLNRSAVLFSTHAIGRRAIVWAVGILRRARNRRCTAALC